MRPLSWLPVFSLLLLALLPPPPAWGQAAGDQPWFVPGGQPRPGQAPPQGGTAPRPAQAQQQAPRPGQAAQPPRPAQSGTSRPAGAAAAGDIPNLPPLPKGNPPPTAVIGVIGVPEIMRDSTAAQGVRQVIDDRRARLNDEVQRKQEGWRRQQQELSLVRSTLTPDQGRERERVLQDRITEEQRDLRDRDAAIQQAGQQAFSAIERAIVAVIRQVADSRGLNLVLHKQTIALNFNEFDITTQVAEQLNKVLPRVDVAPEPAPGVAAIQPPPGAPTQAGAPGAAPAPAGSGAPRRTN